MAGKTSIALFLAVNLVVFSVASACGGNCPTPLNLVKAQVGRPTALPCCPLLDGLVDLEAALCLCTVIKANVLNIVQLNLPINLSVILNHCGKKAPTGFMC
ncbi:unnamed protein product [Triticum turgidum subsp. durum]|uniref:Hydrophobic seed protein domain-containing protein n=1 Tax=Triticum turgidum subsp. durum TaxID=4567 RepID=A0A9R1PVY1_TRITD|nr:unnamed protein product [Triticum turgidum subsp. durum]